MRIDLNRVDARLDTADSKWWRELPPHQKKLYLSQHPKSKLKATDAKPAPAAPKFTPSAVAAPKDFVYMDGGAQSAQTQKGLAHAWNHTLPLPVATFKRVMARPGDQMEFEPVLSANGVSAVNMYVEGRNGSFTMSRLFQRNHKTNELTVAHSEFTVANRQQGKGIGKEMLRKHMAQYQKMGVQRITLHANCDVGGYAWAKYGFTPTKEEWRDLREEIASYADHVDLLTVEQEADREALAKELKRIGASDDPKALWDLADLTTPVKRGDGRVKPYGKDLLQRLGWEGELRLDDAKAMQRFYNYVGEAKPATKPAV